MQKKDFLVITALFLVGFTLRLLLAARLPFMGDECGTMINICYPFSYILTHFHCWLTMNWYIALIKLIAQVFGEGFIAVRLLSVLTGAGSVVLTGLVARRLFSGKAWIIAAALTAFNPYLVSFGAIARVYSLYVFISLVIFLLFLRWRETPSHSNCIGLSLACFALIMFNLNGVFIILWLLIVIAVEVLQRRLNRAHPDVHQFGVKRLIIPGLLCAFVAGLFYAQLIGEIRRYSSEWVVAEITSITYLPNAASLYFTTQTCTWFLGIFMLFGSYRLFRSDRFICAVLILWLLVPIVAAALLGYSFNFWDFARFFIFIVPIIFILSAYGITAIAKFFIHKYQNVIILGSGLLFCVMWLPEINNQLLNGEKIPFHKAYNFTATQMRTHDKIVCLDPFSRLHLAPYRYCNERIKIEKAIATREIFLQSSVPDLLQDTERGHRFLIGTGKYIPHFGTETKSFGDIRVCILPPEPWANRYERLLNGYKNSERLMQTDPNPPETDFFAIYSSLTDLAKLRGDREGEQYYKSFLSGG